MAPTTAAAMVTRRLVNVTSYARARAQHKIHQAYQQTYRETSLQLETKLRDTKQYFVDSVVGKICMNLGKVFTSYKGMRTQDNAAGGAKHQISAVRHGRVNKSYDVEMAKNEYKRMKKRIPILRDTTVHSDFWKKSNSRKMTLAAPSRSPWIIYTPPKYAPVPESGTSYMERLRQLYPPIQDHEEQSKFIRSRLESILGPERMQAGLGLPSGHSGIENDPTLAQYNQEKRICDVFEAHRQYQIDQQRLFEEQQRQIEEQQRNQQHQILEQQRMAAEEEDKAREKTAVYKFLCKRYDDRVIRLAQLGPSIRQAICMLEAAFLAEDLPAFGLVVTGMVNEILEPAKRIYVEMDMDHIFLELHGAQTIKEEWPVDKIDQVLDYFDDQVLSLFADNDQEILRCMLRDLQNIYQPVLQPSPHKNPLIEEQSQPSFAQAMPPNLLHSNQTMQAYSAQTAMPIMQPVLEGENAGKNFSSFADFAKATNARHVPEIMVTAPSFDGSASSGATVSAPENGQVTAIKSFIDSNILEFEMNVGSLVKDGFVRSTQRKEIFDVLESLEQFAAGETGFLVNDDAHLMKKAIKLLISKLASLGTKEKNKTTTRELNVVANKMIKLWVE